MKVLCFGDSNTFGYDPCCYLGSRYGERDRWPDILANETGWDVVNAGENGREIPRRSFELEAAAALINRHKPDLFLVMLGTNDLLQGASPEEISLRMENFLKMALPLCPKILLVAPPALKRGTWVSEDGLVMTSHMLAQSYQNLASKLGIAFVDTSRWAFQLAFDGVHLTQEDHHRLAQIIEKAVV